MSDERPMCHEQSQKTNDTDDDDDAEPTSDHCGAPRQRNTWSDLDAVEDLMLMGDSNTKKPTGSYPLDNSRLGGS